MRKNRAEHHWAKRVNSMSHPHEKLALEENDGKPVELAEEFGVGYAKVSVWFPVGGNYQTAIASNRDSMFVIGDSKSFSRLLEIAEVDVCYHMGLVVRLFNTVRPNRSFVIYGKDKSQYPDSTGISEPTCDEESFSFCTRSLSGSLEKWTISSDYHIQRSLIGLTDPVYLI